MGRGLHETQNDNQGYADVRMDVIFFVKETSLLCVTGKLFVCNYVIV